VLSSSSAIKDLHEKRGEIYSERAHWPILEMYVCHGSILVSQSTAMLTILDFQDEYGLAPLHDRKDRDLAQRTKDIRWQPWTSGIGITSANDGGKDPRIPGTTSCNTEGFPYPYKIVSGHLFSNR
jgi:hypothetical protein